MAGTNQLFIESKAKVFIRIFWRSLVLSIYISLLNSLCSRLSSTHIIYSAEGSRQMVQNQFPIFNVGMGPYTLPCATLAFLVLSRGSWCTSWKDQIYFWYSTLKHHLRYSLPFIWHWHNPRPAEIHPILQNGILLGYEFLSGLNANIPSSLFWHHLPSTISSNPCATLFPLGSIVWYTFLSSCFHHQT